MRLLIRLSSIKLDGGGKISHEGQTANSKILAYGYISSDIRK